MLPQHTRCDLARRLHQVNDRAVTELRTDFAEGLEGSEAWVGVAQDTMAVAMILATSKGQHFGAKKRRGDIYAPRDDPSALQRRPKVLLNLLRRRVGANLLLHGEDPAENFLIR